MNLNQTCIMIANGDLRIAANQGTWSTQLRAEQEITRAIRAYLQKGD